MGVDFRVVVSSENNPYMAWQTQLFCFSALTRMGKHPTVVVHRSIGPLHPEFKIVQSWGCPVLEAPAFWIHPVGEFPPRNEVGTLLACAARPEFREGHILFCEPDMLFVKKLEYDGELSGEYYDYLDFGRERIRSVAQKFEIADRWEVLNDNKRIGVPYLIPAAEVPRIAERWIEVLDSFKDLEWVDIAYAFGLALAIEQLPIKTTHLVVTNYNPVEHLDRCIIHYRYGDWRWNKRAFDEGRSPLSSPLPSTKGLSGTILGEMFYQIRQAQAYSRFPRIFGALWRLVASVSE